MKTIKTLVFIFATAMMLTSCSDDNNSPQLEISSAVLFTTNNADGNVKAFQFTDSKSTMSSTFTTATVDADGVYFDSSSNTIVQASRSTLGLQGYTGISALDGSATVTIGVTGSLDMMSPRELAVNGNIYVVADNANPEGRFFVYTKVGNQFTLRNTITTNFKVWGVTFGGSNGNDLFAVVDTTGDLAVFTNFLSNSTSAIVMPSKRVTIEGIVRTHGLTYDAASDTMVLTDIADAASGTDGGFHVIANFSSVFNGTANGATLAINQQIRVAGSNTVLGNPVDVAFDGRTETVYIAEAKNGKILAFTNFNAGGNIAPTFSADVAKASAVYLHKQ